MDWKSARVFVLPLLLATAPGFGLLADGHDAPSPSDKMAKMLREASLTLLKEGNSRFAHGRAQHPNQEAERRLDVAKNGQNPLATILTCSDSRAPVELVFDRGVGDLFVVRVAGNVATAGELASIEYGVGHLNTPLLIVLGHTRCGAVTAVAQGAELHGHLPILAAQIEPAVAKAKQAGGDLIKAAIRANVWLTLDNILNQCPEVKQREEAGLLSVLGGVYDLDTGVVEWLAKPAQSAPAVTEHPPEPVSPGSHLQAESTHAAPPSSPPAKPSPVPPGEHGDEPAAKPAPGRHGAPPVSAAKANRNARPAEDSLMLNPPIAGTAPFGLGTKRAEPPKH